MGHTFPYPHRLVSAASRQQEAGWRPCDALDLVLVPLKRRRELPLCQIEKDYSQYTLNHTQGHDSKGVLHKRDPALLSPLKPWLRDLDHSDRPGAMSAHRSRSAEKKESAYTPPSRLSQRHVVASNDAEAMTWPLGDHATHRTVRVCPPSKVPSHSHCFCASAAPAPPLCPHTRTVLSPLHEASRSPSALHATHHTRSLCPACGFWGVLALNYGSSAASHPVRTMRRQACTPARSPRSPIVVGRDRPDVRQLLAHILTQSAPSSVSSSSSSYEAVIVV